MNFNELKIMIDDRPLTTQIQEYVCEILNNNPDFKDWGIVFYPENALDIDFQIKNAMSKQGLACVVMTPTLNYQGHDALTQTFTLDDLTIQVVENTIINRARLKKEGKEFGTALDVASKASDILAGPQSGHFGEFTTKRIEQGEDGNLVVAKAVFGTTMYKQVDGIIEWDDNGHKVEIPFVTKEQIKNLENEVGHLQDLVIGFDTEEIKTKVNELEQATNRIEVEITSLSDVYQPIGNYLTPDDLIPYALKNEIPTKVSQLVNDSEFINKNQVDWDLINDKPNVALKSEIPTKTSELDNDAGFTKVVESNDYPGYAENANQAVYAKQAKSSEVATTAMNVDWSNVSGKPNIPTKTSELENDSGYLSTVSWNDIQNRPNVALVDDIPTKVSDLTNDSGYLTTVSWNDVQGKPNIVEREYLDSRLVEYPTKVEMNNTIDEKISEIVIPENTKLYSPSKNRYIQGDSSVWETRTEPGHWTDWKWSDGNDHTSEITIYKQYNHKYRAGIEQLRYVTPEFDTEDEVQNYLNSQSRIEWTNYNDSTEIIVSTRQWVEGKTEFVQVETLAYESQLPTKVSDLTNDAGYLTTISWNDIQNRPNIALKSDIPTRTSELINDSGFITTSPDFSLYYTKVECNDRFQPIGNYLTEHQSLANYYTIEEIQNGFQVKGNYLTEHQSLANYYTKQECDERFGSVSSIVKKLYSANEQRYIDGDGLLWKKDESGQWGYYDELAKKSEIPSKNSELTNDSGFITEVYWSDVQQKPDLPTQKDLTILRNDIQVELDKKADKGTINTDSIESSEKKIDADGNVYQKVVTPGHFTDWVWSNGVDYSQGMIIYSRQDKWYIGIDQDTYSSKFYDSEEKCQEVLNTATHIDWYSSGDYEQTTIVLTSDRQWIGDEYTWNKIDELAYKSGLTGIDTRIGQIESTTNGLTTTVNGLSTTVDGISNRVDTYDSRIGQIESTTNGLSTTVTGITNSVNGLTTTVNGLSTTVNGISNRVDTVETRIGQIDGRVTGVEGSIETIQGTVGGIQTSVSQIQTSVSQVQTDVQNVQDKVSTGQWIDLIGETESGTTITFQIFAKGI